MMRDPSVERTPRDRNKLIRRLESCWIKIRFALQMLKRSSTSPKFEVCPVRLSDFMEIEGVFWTRVGRHMNTISTCHLDPWIDLEALTCSSKGRRRRGCPSWPCDALMSKNDRLENSKMRPSHSGVNALVLFSGRWNTHFSSSFEGICAKSEFLDLWRDRSAICLVRSKLYAALYFLNLPWRSASRPHNNGPFCFKSACVPGYFFIMMYAYS